MSSELKATPGPWVAKQMRHSAVVLQDRKDVRDNYMNRVAECPYWTGIETQPDAEAAMANALMMAAAHDLYEALELVARRCGPRSADGAIARAALARARGETPANTGGQS